MNKISIIIPTLNEERSISILLQHLLRHSNSELIEEIIVVDGGSQDQTTNLVKSFDEATLIGSQKGRSVQLNTGAQKAKADILYFIHADCLPPKGFDSLIISEIEKGNRAGCFRLQFESSHWWLKLAGWFTRFNWRICRGGDQSLFITKTLFNEIGGFDESYLIYEDNIMIEELYKRGAHVVIKQPIRTSSRRYKQAGIWKLQYHFWKIHLKHKMGASALDLWSYYRRHIAS